MPAISKEEISERLKKTYGAPVNVADRGNGTVQYRSFAIRASDMKDDRTMDISFSSDTPATRSDWMGSFEETLGHEAGEIDDSRMQSGAPLLVNHTVDDHVGTVVPGSFKVEKDPATGAKKGRCTVRFGNSARAQEIHQDVKDGIRGQISVGYNVNDWESKESQENGLESVRVTNWTPCEVSLASIPLDQTVGVGRSVVPPAQPKENNTVKRNVILRDPVTETGGNGNATVTVTAETAIAGERKRTAELLALGDQFNCREEATKWVRDNTTKEAATDWVLQNRMNAKPVTPAQQDTKIGMDQRDLKRYSLVRAMRTLGADRPLDGFELDCSQEVAKKLGRSVNGRGFFIPEDYQNHRPEVVGERSATPGGRFLNAMSRALGATFGPAGGFTVQTDVLGENMIELLRNRTYVLKLGARMLSGLVGDVAIPKQTGPGSAYWLAEGVQIPASQQVLGQMLLKPHQLGARTIYSKQLLAQASIDIETFVREDLMTVSGLALDLAALAGPGGASPIGILNTTGVNTVTFGGTADWAHVLSFEMLIAQQNADVANMNWMTTPAVRGKWKNIPKISASTFPIYLWDDDGEVNGYPGYVTNQVPGNKVLFGNWADLFVATWAGMEVIVNPYTYASSGQVEVNVLQLADIGVRHPESFAVSTDAGNQ